MTASSRRYRAMSPVVFPEKGWPGCTSGVSTNAEPSARAARSSGMTHSRAIECTTSAEAITRRRSRSSTSDVGRRPSMAAPMRPPRTGRKTERRSAAIPGRDHAGFMPTSVT